MRHHGRAGRRRTWTCNPGAPACSIAVASWPAVSAIYSPARVKFLLPSASHYCDALKIRVFEPAHFGNRLAARHRLQTSVTGGIDGRWTACDDALGNLVSRGGPHANPINSTG